MAPVVEHVAVPHTRRIGEQPIAHRAPAWWESRAFIVALVALSTLPLLYPPIPPLVDLFGHMGRYRVQLDLHNSPWLPKYYGFHWAAIGNLGVDLLVMPLALKALIDDGLVAADPDQRLMALREHFLALFAVGAALGVFSAARFYMVTWLGERITADLRNAVYAHVVRQSPEFFEVTQTGEVLSRLTTDTTLVQTVVGSSLSMGLRNAVMGVGAMSMLIVSPVCTMSGRHPRR